jgi:LacI family transcriptional regulator
VAGILIALSRGDKQDLGPYERLEESGIPVVFFDKVPDEKGFSTVTVADEVAGNMAAEALLRKPRRKILAVFGEPSLSITRKRQQAFTNTCRKIAPSATLKIIHAGNRQQAFDGTLQALSRKDSADGLFCMSDEILAGAMKAVHRLQIPVPEKLGIVCISNGFIPGLFHPEITYVETSGAQLGKRAFRAMLERIVHQSPPQEEVLDARLVEGGSL